VAGGDVSRQICAVKLNKEEGCHQEPGAEGDLKGAAAGEAEGGSPLPIATEMRSGGTRPVPSDVLQLSANEEEKKCQQDNGAALAAQLVRRRRNKKPRSSSAAPSATSHELKPVIIQRDDVFARAKK